MSNFPKFSVLQKLVKRYIVCVLTAGCRINITPMEVVLESSWQLAEYGLYRDSDCNQYKYKWKTVVMWWKTGIFYAFTLRYYLTLSLLLEPSGTIRLPLEGRVL